LSAAATGLEMLAVSSQLANAEIVYTRAHVNVTQCHAYGIDIDHTGTVDVYLNWCGGEGLSYAVASADPYLGNGIAVSHNGFALPMFLGAKIGPARRFYGNSFEPAMAVASFSTTNPVWHGLWADGGKGLKNRYLGIKFKSHGQFHYGWARVSITISTYIREVLLTGYAYETVPNKAIIAGQTKGPEGAESGKPSSAAVTEPRASPATLGLLASGAPGLSIWRRKQSFEPYPLTK